MPLVPPPRPTTPRSTTDAARRERRSAAAGRAPAERLAESRTAFLASVARDTPGSDLARYTAVLDELLAWAEARPERFVPSAATAVAGVIGFERPDGVAGVRWSLRPVRGGAPVMEVVPAPGDGHEAARTRVRAVFHAHSRAVLADDERLRIGFGALKNPAARAAVLTLLDALIDDPDGAAEAAALALAEASRPAPVAEGEEPDLAAIEASIAASLEAEPTDKPPAGAAD